MITIIRPLYSLCIELLFPKCCVCCRALGTLLCTKCANQCSFYNRPCKIDKTYAPFPVLALTYFEGKSKKIIQEYKYSGIQELGSLIAQMLYEHCTIPESDVITYVPLHIHKQKKRGFNQSKLIAEQLALLLNIPCVELLVRTEESAIQAQIKGKTERLSNAADLYTLNPKNEHSNKKIKLLIIDDVCTTGATLGACGKVLAQAGFTNLTALVVAHGR